VRLFDRRRRRRRREDEEERRWSYLPGPPPFPSWPYPMPWPMLRYPSQKSHIIQHIQSPASNLSARHSQPSIFVIHNQAAKDGKADDLGHRITQDVRVRDNHDTTCHDRTGLPSRGWRFLGDCESAGRLKSFSSNSPPPCPWLVCRR